MSNATLYRGVVFVGGKYAAETTWYGSERAAKRAAKALAAAYKTKWWRIETAATTPQKEGEKHDRVQNR